MKRLILVTSPPASGKTYVSKMLAKNLKHVVYLDKDTLIVLSKQIFVVAGQEYNRSSDFFEQNIRNYEYMAIVDLALEALEYDDIVLINAPFKREVRDKAYMAGLRERLEEKDARLTVIWVDTEVEVCRQRMILRNSERDKWKIENWDEYIAGQNFDIPSELNNPDCKDDLIIFKNSTDEQFSTSMKQVLDIVEGSEFCV
ncbi:MAG: AAA family ATPase [Eubacteriales bacterium]